MKYKSYIIFWSINLVYLLILLLMILVPFGGKDCYYADGKVLLNDEQWEQFKIDIITQSDINLKNINILNGQSNNTDTNIQILDYGKSKVVQFNGLKVDNNFHYGKIHKEYNKSENSTILFIEWFIFITGIVAFSISLICFVIDYNN